MSLLRDSTQALTKTIKTFAGPAKASLRRRHNRNELIKQLLKLSEAASGFEKTAYRIVVANLQNRSKKQVQGVLDFELAQNTNIQRREEDGEKTISLESGANRETQEELLRHIGKIEDAIEIGFKNYSRISDNCIQSSPIEERQKLPLRLHYDYASIRGLSPEIYKAVIQHLNKTGILNILSELKPPKDSHLGPDEIKKVFDFYRQFKKYLSEPNQAVAPELHALLGEFADKIHKIAEASSSIHQFNREIQETQNPTEQYLLAQAMGGLRAEVSSCARDIQPFFHSYNEKSKTVDYVKLGQFAQANRRNGLFVGFSKIAALITAGVITAASIANPTDASPTKDPQANTETSSESSETTEKQAQKQSSKVNSLDANQTISDAGMDSNNSEPGVIDNGVLVYSVEAHKNPHQTFLINDVYQYEGNTRKISVRNGMNSESDEPIITQTIKLESNNYKKGETLKLLIEPNSFSLNIRTNKPYAHTINREIITFTEDVNDLTIEYDLSPSFKKGHLLHGSMYRLSTGQPVEIPTLATELSSLRQKVQNKDLKNELPQYLSKFKYILSNELNTLIQRMPGLQERNLSFIRCGDCDMLANHLAWGLQDIFPCGVGIGYIDEDVNGKVYSGNRHARFLTNYNPNYGLTDYEVTSQVRGTFIFPTNQGFKPEHLELLEGLVNQINQTDNQEQRDGLMIDFGKTLDLILEDDYYSQFKPKNKISNSRNAMPDGFGEKPNLEALWNPRTISDTFQDGINLAQALGSSPLASLICALGALWTIGLSSLAIRSFKLQENNVIDQYKVSENGFIAVPQLMSYIPILEGGRVIGLAGGKVVKTGLQVARLPYDAHRFWANNAEARSTQKNQKLLVQGSSHPHRDTAIDINAHYSIEGDGLNGLNEGSVALLKTLIAIKKKHKVEIPDTYFERLVWLFNRPLAEVIPEYRPAWAAFTANLNDRLRDSGTMSESIFLRAMKDSFESMPAYQKAKNRIDVTVDAILGPEYNRHPRTVKLNSKSTLPKSSEATSASAHNRPTKRPGQGTEFHSHREYVSGDSIHHIDWNATARLAIEDQPVIKVYEQESDAQRTAHRISFAVDCQKVISNPSSLEGIVRGLELSRQHPQIQIESIDIYSFGNLVRKIDLKEIKHAMQKTHAQRSGEWHLIRSILATTYDKGIFLSSPDLQAAVVPYSLQAIPLNSREYSNANVWPHEIDSLLDRLSGQTLQCDLDDIPLTRQKSVISGVAPDQRGRILTSDKTETRSINIIPS